MNDVNFIMKNVALFAGVSEATVSALVADSVTAISLCDLLALRFGTDWLA